MSPQFDAKDAELLAARVAKWNARKGPRVGDYVKLPDGSLRRFTHDWGEDIQTTCDNGDASFYFARDGYASFSGSLDRAILKTRIEETPESRRGHFWMFHHDESRAHNGVQVMAPCRVYRVQP